MKPKRFFEKEYMTIHQKNYFTNKSDAFHIENFWKMDSLNLNDYGRMNNEVIDIFQS